MKTEISEKLFERSKKVAPGGVHSPVRSFKDLGMSPLFFKSAQGARITSEEGEAYIDYCMSFGPLILGHKDPDVKEAVLGQIDRLWTSGTCEAYSLELAEFIINEICFLEKIRFVSSGTEAVMSSLRVARGFTGKDKVLKFEGCYHGHVDSLLVKAGSGLAGESASSSAGVSEATAAQTLTLKLGDKEAFVKLMDGRADELAAVIIEPLPANFGLLTLDTEYLQLLRDKCTEKNVLLIFDEVISGFRMGLGGMACQLGIFPDLVTYGKILGGGFPVGGYGGRAEIMNKVAPVGPVYQAGTLSANPVGMVAGLTTLKKLKNENGHQMIEEMGQYFQAESQKIIESKSLNLKMIRRGSLFWFCESADKDPQSIDDIPKTHGARFRDFFLHLLRQHIYIAPNAFEVGFLSLAHNKKIIDETLEALKTYEEFH